MSKVSFQGESGAYSESASNMFFQEELTTVPCSTFKQVLDNTCLLYTSDAADE